MAGILLKDIQALVTMDSGRSILRGVSVRIEGREISEVGANLAAREGERVIDCSNHVV